MNWIGGGVVDEAAAVMDKFEILQLKIITGLVELSGVVEFPSVKLVKFRFSRYICPLDVVGSHVSEVITGV